VLALHEHAERLLDVGETGRAAVGVLAHQHLAAQAERLDARSEVHLVADHRVLVVDVRAEEPGHHLAGIDADPHEKLGQPLHPVGAVQLVHRALHLHRAGDRAVRVVGMRDRRAEEPHDRVAHELVDHAAVGVDDAAHPREVAVQHLEHHAGRLLGGDAGESAQVREQDRDLPAGEAADFAQLGALTADAREQRLQLRRRFAAQRRAGRLGDELLDAAQRLLDAWILHARPG